MSTAPSDVAPRRVLLVLFLGVLIAALDIAIVGPALPALQDAFGVDRRTVSWVFNTFVLFNLVSIPLMSRLADLFGRRLIFAVDVLLFGVGASIVALAPDFTVLLAGRAVQGMAAAGIFPAASAVVGDTFPVEKHGRALGVLGAVYGIAFVIGPILAGVVLSVGRWTWLFWMAVPLAVVVSSLGWYVLPSTRADEAQALDLRGMALLGGGLALLAYGVNRVEADAFVQSVLATGTWPFLGGALVLGTLFIGAERRAPDPLLRLELFASGQVRIASALAFGAGLTEAAFIFFPDLAVVAFGVSDSHASFMLLPLVVAVAIGSPIAGRVLDRVGSRTIVLFGTAMFVAGFGSIAGWTASRVVFYGGSVAIGIGLACLLGSALSYILLRESEAEERTVAQGVVALFLGVGQLMGGAFIGAVAESSGTGIRGYANAFWTITAITLVLLLLGFQLKSRHAERAPS